MGSPGLTTGDEVLTLGDMTDMVRAAGLRGFHALVSRLGGDPAALLRRHGLPTTLDDEELLLPVSKLVRLLENSAQVLECPDFGLQLAQAQDISILGPVAVAIQNSPTIGEALQVASRYLFVHNQAMSFAPVFDSLPDANLVELRYTVEANGLPPARQSFDVMMGGGHRFLTLLGGEHYHLMAAHLPHSPRARPAVYERYFGVKVQFKQTNAALIITRDLFDAPLPQANATLRGLATSYLEQNFGKTRKALVPRVRMAAKRALGSPQCSLDRIAELFAMHPRTLQRHLADEGTTFEAIRDTVTKDAALRYLSTSRLPLSQVSALLGLSEQSALTRSCNRWFGETPSALRRRLAEAQESNQPG